MLRTSPESWDGPLMSHFIQAGTRSVVANREAINRINVFPVADGDTGSNLSNTLLAIARYFGRHREPRLDLTARAAADAAIDSAHGNAGTIFAQFLHGFALAVRGCAQLDIQGFGQAVTRGAEAAYAALGAPQEGTILSVLRDWARQVAGSSRISLNYQEVLVQGLAAARAALRRTTDQLEILKRHGVVDAGAQGFVNFLEGVDAWMHLGPESAEMASWLSSIETETFENAQTAAHPMSGGKRYCCNVLLEGRELDCKHLLADLNDAADSLVLAGGEHRTRLHLHMDEPSLLLSRLAAHGSILSAQIEDMFAQQDLKSPGGLALVSDSTCELPEAESNSAILYRVPLKVTMPHGHFLDGVSMPPIAFYQHLRRSRKLPTTSQPSQGDFIRLYRHLLRSSESILSIHLAEAISGTAQVARRAAEEVARDRIHVVDSRQVSVGLGLLMRQAFAARTDGLNAEQIAERLHEGRQHIRVWGTTPSLEHAVRGGRVDARTARVAEAIGVKPIIEFDPMGKPGKVGIKIGFSRAQEELLRRAKRFCAGGVRSAMVVHADNLEAGRRLATLASRELGLPDIDVVLAGAVLGSHVGPGAVAIAVERQAPRL